MATLNLLPDSNASPNDWAIGAGSGAHYTLVDDPVGSPDDATTYLKLQQFFQNGEPVLKLSTTETVGATKSPTSSWGDFTEQFNDAPGSTGWTKQQIKDVIFGFKGTDNGFPSNETYEYFNTNDVAVDAIASGDTINWVKIHVRLKDGGSNLYMTQIYLEVDYTPLSVNYPAPTSVQIDRIATPASNVSEDPLFTAIFNDGATGDSVDRVWVEVAEDSAFVTKVQTGSWVTIASLSDGNRSAEVSYSGTYLEPEPPDGTAYYIRIKFKNNTSGTESDFSATAQMTGFTRAWADNNFTHRQRLLWNIANNPDGVPADYVQTFTIKTGTRRLLSNQGYFNEAVQASGGFQVEYLNGVTYVVFLGRASLVDGQAQINILALNHTTDVITEYNIGNADTTFDTHNFPTICIDNSGFLHVFMIRHDQQGFHWKSTNAEDITSWNIKQTLGSGVANGTYPVPFVVPSSGDIYLFFRGGGAASNRVMSFVRSTDDGATWTTDQKVIDDKGTGAFRIYHYGIRFDKTLERLYLAWSYNHSLTGDDSGNEKETGVWFAYSDLDETNAGSLDIGFNLWRDIDGSLLGRTSEPIVATRIPIGYNNDTAWATEAARAIRFWSTNTGETDRNKRVFIETLELLSDGSPVVFFEQKAYHFEEGTGPTQDTHLMAATHNGTVWTVNSISDQLNLKLRVRRSSIGVMTDRNGVLRVFMPVSGSTWHHFLPDADVDDVGITEKTGVDNFAMVDDLIAENDGEGSYIDIAATTGKASFTHSGTMKADVTILAVEVRAIVQNKVAAANTDIQLYVQISGTDYNSATKTVDYNPGRWKEFGNRWKLNPNTSAAWTKTQVEALEFGIKNVDSANVVRATQVYARVLWQNGSDDEGLNSEIAELSSTDGKTFSFVRWVSGNSHIGVPIMNHKHHLSNDAVEVIWTSGNDIFYLTDEGFGLFQGDMRDARLYYKGVEIDRIIDYANMDLTTITFKVQAAIPANKAIGPGDYHLYYASKNIVTQPKSDPQQIYIFYENAEQYDRNDNLSGVGGWTVTTFTATVYESPPDHANKIFSGLKSIDVSASGSMVNTIGSALTKLRALISMWQEFGSDLNMYATFIDSGGTEFGGGCNFATSGGRSAGHWDGTSLVKNTAVQVEKNQWHQVEITIGAGTGGMVKVDGNPVMFGIKGLDSVDKLKLVANSHSFFDNIRVFQSLKGISSVTDGILFGIITQQSDHTTQWIFNDGKWESTRSDVKAVRINIEARVVSGETDTGDLSFEIRLSDKVPYDKDSIVDTVSWQFLTVNTSTWGTWAKEFRWTNLAAGSYSVKIDFYANTSTGGNHEGRIESVDAYYEGQDPTIDLQSKEIHGMVMGGVLIGADQDQMTMGGVINDDFVRHPQIVPSEYGAGLSVPQRVSTAYSGNVTAALRAIIGYQQSASVLRRSVLGYGAGVQGLSRHQIEYLSGITSGLRNVPVAWSGNLIASTRAPIEYRGSVSAIVNRVPVEYGAGVSAPGRAPIENLSSLSTGGKIPVAWSGFLTVLTSVPIENLLAISQGGSVRVGYGAGTSTSGAVPVEYRSAISSGGNVPVAWSGFLTALMSIPVSNLLKMSSPSVVPIEFGSTSSITRNIPVESLSSISSPGEIPIEYRGAIATAMSIPVEYLAMATGRVVIPIEELLKLSGQYRTSIEYIAGLSAGGAVPTEYRGNISTGMSVPIEYLASIEAISGQVPLGYALGFTSRGQAIVGYSAGLSAPTRVIVGWQAGASLSVAGAIPIENLAGLSVDLNVPVELLSGVTASRVAVVSYRASILARLQTSLGYGVTFSTDLNIPTETLAGLASEARAMSEWLSASGLSARGAVPIEFRGALSAAGMAPLDWGASISRAGQVAIENLSGASGKASAQLEYLNGLIAAGKIPTEWRGVLFTAIALANARLNAPNIVNVTLTAPEIDGLRLIMSRLDEVILSQPKLDNVELNDADTINEKLKGGNEWLS